MTRSVTQFLTSYSARRYNVMALGLVLCAWLVAAAMHLHLEDQGADSAESAHCAYCFALSTGAAPAPELHVPAVVPTPAALVAGDDAPIEDRTTTSFYLSRGPPAA